MFNQTFFPQQRRAVVLVPCIESHSNVQVFVELVELASDDIALQQVLQELLAFCEVVSRTSLIHELRITPFSLGTAVARGLTPQSVVACLKKVVRYESDNNQQLGVQHFAKVQRFIIRCMNSFTRARLVIRGATSSSNHQQQVNNNNNNNNNMMMMMSNANSNNININNDNNTKQVVHQSNKIVVECEDEQTYNTLYNDKIIQQLVAKEKKLKKPQQQKEEEKNNNILLDDDDDDDMVMIIDNNRNNKDEATTIKQPQDFSFELQDIQCANHAVARSFALGMPLRRQYDFEGDTELRKLNVALRPSAQPRPYQKAAVESAIVSITNTSNNNNQDDDDADNDQQLNDQHQQRYSNSGVIVIPCGGGKTLVGVMCFTAIRRPTVILCVNAISVDQWKEQIEKYATGTTGGGGSGSAASAAYQKYNRHQTQNNRSKSGGNSSTQIKISLWTAKKKDPITRETDVVITTYHALAGLVRRRELQKIALSASNAVNKGGAKNKKKVASNLLDDDEDDDNQDPIQKQFNEEIMKQQQNKGKKFANNSLSSTNNSIYLKNPLLDWSWGLLILDEAHVVPATYFRDGVNSISAKCTIGLTATFVREDDKIGDLQHLCGPKLFDIGWETLRDAGYLASVKCREVVVPLPVAFQTEYWNRMRSKFDFVVDSNSNNDDHDVKLPLVGKNSKNKKKIAGKRRQRDEEEETSSSSSDDDDENDDVYVSDDDSDTDFGNRKSNKKRPGNNKNKNNNDDDDLDSDLTPTSNKNLHPVLIALAASNPNKILCAKRICERHRGQKILIFCDIITLLLEYANQLKCPAIHGGTPHAERVRLFSDFENTSSRNVLCVSRVGEIAINLPSARVVIQVSSHGGSRRQEVQRLGRVLRPKNDDNGTGIVSNNSNSNSSWFYSLVSSDTIEVDYASRRSRFLIDQGYQTDTEHFEIPSEVVAAQQQSTATTPNGDSTSNKDDDNKSRVKFEMNNNNINNNNHFLNRDWILAWLVKVIARWELDFAPNLMRLQGAASKKNKKNKNNNNVPMLQENETRQQRSALSRWTAGAEKDKVVYDEA